MLAIADEIGYRPDSAARLLAQGRSRTLGVMTDVRQLFQADSSPTSIPPPNTWATKCCVGKSVRPHQATVVESLLSHRCGALILLGPNSDADYLRELARPVPVVVAGRRLPAAAHAGMLATVRSNDAKGIRLAIDYLVELGHRAIHHVDGGDDPGAADRRRAYLAAMRAHGLSGEAKVIPAPTTKRPGRGSPDDALPVPVPTPHPRRQRPLRTASWDASPGPVSTSRAKLPHGI